MVIRSAALEYFKQMNPEFWKGRKVLLTGHTGFKGAWLSAWLNQLDAEVVGLSLPAEDRSLWRTLRGHLSVQEELIDLADFESVSRACARTNFEIVIHMAAQAQVRVGYEQPRATFQSNVMGTVNLLEALRPLKSVETVLVVTSDKVYLNDNSGTPFNESSALGGFDPYSASKAATEHVAQSYARSFFGKPVATARAGNVIGGGDFSSDRLVPDLFRAFKEKRSVALRYPDAVRPWQHVLDCLSGYLTFAERLVVAKQDCPRALNFGPSDHEAKRTVAELSDMICARWAGTRSWTKAEGSFAPESKQLVLDAKYANRALGWKSFLGTDAAIDWTADWYSRYASGEDAYALTLEQIASYSSLAKQ